LLVEIQWGRRRRSSYLQEPDIANLQRPWGGHILLRMDGRTQTCGPIIGFKRVDAMLDHGR